MHDRNGVLQALEIFLLQVLIELLLIHLIVHLIIHEDVLLIFVHRL